MVLLVFSMQARDMPFKLVFLIISAVVPIVSSEGLQKRSEALITSVFSNVDSITLEMISMSESTQAHLYELTGTQFDDGVVDLFSVYRNDSIVGFGVTDSVRSKSSFLPFLVITDKKGTIQLVELLSTPDPRSAKLRSQLWKKQFIGKKEIKSRQIDAISGATISSKDITHGVIRLLKYLRFTRKLEM